MIRTATLQDVPVLVAMGRRQMAELFPDWPDNPVQLTALTTHLIEAPNSIVFVAEDASGMTGMIGMTLYTHHITGELTAGEVAWWVEPDARGIGVALLKRAESWGAECGATQIQMNAPNERVGLLYKRRGYRPLETAYQKAVA